MNWYLISLFFFCAAQVGFNVVVVFYVIEIRGALMSHDQYIEDKQAREYLEGIYNDNQT